MKKIIPPEESSADESFQRELYQKLELEMKPKTSIINFGFMNKFKIAFVSTAVVAAAVLVYVNIRQNQNLIFSSKQQITKLDERAFGSLTNLTGPRGMGGGGGPEADKMAANPVSGMGGGSSDTMPPYYPMYKYVYKGAAFSIDADKMEVFERQKGFGSSDLSSFLGRFDLGVVNMNKFGQAQVSYLNAMENRDLGYGLSIDFREGVISIDPNWEKWPNPDLGCTEQSCYENNRVKIEQIPSDETVIAAADKFLDEYGIDRGSLGQPYVQNFWRADYERATDKSQVYVPDSVNIVYPIRVSGNELYDESGNKTGLNVTYNIRAGKISSVNQITSQRYQSSQYQTEQDVTRLLKVAEIGGYYSYLPFAADAAGNAQITELELGKPTTGYVRLWQYTNNQNKELFVPSLIFPIINPPSGYAQNITVPLIKEILDSHTNNDLRIMK